MTGVSDKYLAKSIAEEFKPKIAVIVGADTPNNTQYSGKFGDTPPNVVARRYRIRILGEDPADKPENRLPLAYPLHLTSGLGAQDMGIIKYPPNTFVYISEGSNGEYFIERVVPNHIAKLFENADLAELGNVAASGFLPGSKEKVPTSHTLNKKLIAGGELPGVAPPSDEDKKESEGTELPRIKEACDTVNVDGINHAIDGLIKDVESIKTGLLGDDSFLATSQNFLSDAQNFVSNTIPNASLNVGIGTESYDISIGNAAGDIARIMAA